MSNLTLQAAPAAAIVDQNNVLTINWQPPVCPDGLFDQYSGWSITYQGSGPAITQFFPAPSGYSGQSLLFTQVLGASTAPYTITMTANAVSSFALTNVATAVGSTAVYSGAINGGNNSYAGITFVVAGFTISANNGTFLCVASTATTLTLQNGAASVESHQATAAMSPSNSYDSDPWETSGASAPRAFPTALTTASLGFSSTTLLLGQALTVTLNPAYTGADQWQVLWPDNTSTGFLPLASNVVVKSFSQPGTFFVTVQTLRSYGGSQYAPPSTEISQIQQQIFVVDQQSTSTSTAQQGLTGNLGIGGQQGFEITTATSGANAPNPWEILARVLVRDTKTQELKLLVASTRFGNASSLFGTMAVDVYPISGRPRSKELVFPPYVLTATATTETVPVSVSTTSLPTLFVGKSVVQALGGTFQMQVHGGIGPFIWSVEDLPIGVTMNTAGVINGTPLELGLFTANFAVSDSSTPPSIGHATLTMLVETDMLVQIAPSQTYTILNQPPVPPTVTPLVPTATTLGVAQVGTPYNVQMVVGNINSSSTLPGGLPPYQWSAPAGAFPAGLSINANTGLITGTPQTYNSTSDFRATYSVTIQVTDSIGAKATQTYTLTLAPAPLQFGQVNQTVAYTFEEFKLVVPVFGGQSPYTLSGFGPNPADINYYGAPVLVDGQIEIPVGGSTSTTAGGFPTTGNRTFLLSVLDNASHVASAQFTVNIEQQLSDIRLVPAFLTNEVHPTDGSWGIFDTTQAFPLPVSGNLSGLSLNGVRINIVSNASTAGGNTVYTGVIPSISFSTSDVYIVSGLAAGNNGAFNYVASTPSSPSTAPNGTITLNNPNGIITNASTLTLASVANASAGSTVYTGSGFDATVNFYAGQFFVVSGFVLNQQNNGTFLCTASTGTTLTLVNPFGAAETHAATASIVLGKALKGVVLGNGISTAIDPTSATLSSPVIQLPDSEWFGPPGDNAVNANAYFGNAQTRVLMQVNQQLPFAFAASAVGGSTVYTYATAQPESTSNAFQNLQFTVSGFLNSNNNGTFTCTASTATTLTLSNPNGVATFSAISATTVVTDVLTVTTPNSLTPGQQVYIQGCAESQINTQRLFNVATVSNPPSGPSTAFTTPFTFGNFSNPSEPAGAIVITPQPFAAAVVTVESISREYTTLSHSDPATCNLTAAAASIGTTAVYTGNIIGGGNNAFFNFFFTVTGFTNASNNGYFLCTASTTSTLTLANSAAVLETHPAIATGDIGTISAFPQPYIVGNVVGLNPRKPYFNSPQLAPLSGSASPYAPVPLTAQVVPASILPPGLSLDANTGLIYGTLIGTQSTPTAVQYTDAGGSIHGTATINWALYQSAFQLIDNVIDTQPIGTPYNGLTAFTAPLGVTLQSASLIFGSLPRGLQVGASGSNITISGTPVEAGYFDCWFSCISTTGQQAYAYHRISTVVASTVLTIVGWSDPSAPAVINSFIGNALPNATISATQQYGPSSVGVQLVATGGITPYTWVSSPTPMNTKAPNLALASSGLITGVAPSAFSPNPATFSFTVTDSASNTATVSGITITSQPSGLHFNNSPFTIAIVSGIQENFQFTASGSPNTPYTFQLSPNNTNALPVGIGVSASGLVSGISTQSGYNKSVLFRVVDTVGTYVDQAFTVTVGVGLQLQTGIDFSDGTTTNYLGYVDAGNVATITPSPNLSFHVVATNVVSTSTSTISVSLSNSALSVGTIQLNTGTKTAIIPLLGPFNAGAPGNNDLVVSVTDSGVQITKTFMWLVYIDGTLIVTPSTGTFPTQLLS